MYINGPIVRSPTRRLVSLPEMPAGNPEKAYGELPNPRPMERKILLIRPSEQESQDNFKAYARCVSKLLSIQESRELSQSLETRANNGCRAEFQKNIFVGKKDFTAIEYFLRKGQRQLEMYSSPGIRNIR